MVMGLVFLAMIYLTGLDGQVIELNPHSIVTLRVPRGVDHFDKDVKCLIHTSDGKTVAVVETCDQVHKLLEDQ